MKRLVGLLCFNPLFSALKMTISCCTLIAYASDSGHVSIVTRLPSEENARVAARVDNGFDDATYPYCFGGLDLDKEFFSRKYERSTVLSPHLMLEICS
eukprot:IDg8901t1